MTREHTGKQKSVRQRMAEEEMILEKVDKGGDRWTKVYFGGGAHFRNWFNQFLELRGEENLQVEEIDSRGFQCYEESGEKMYRVWVRNSGSEQAHRPP